MRRCKNFLVFLMAAGLFASVCMGAGCGRNNRDTEETRQPPSLNTDVYRLQVNGHTI